MEQLWEYTSGKVTPDLNLYDLVMCKQPIVKIKTGKLVYEHCEMRYGIVISLPDSNNKFKILQITTKEHPENKYALEIFITDTCYILCDSPIECDVHFTWPKMLKDPLRFDVTKSGEYTKINTFTVTRYFMQLSSKTKRLVRDTYKRYLEDLASKNESGSESGTATMSKSEPTPKSKSLNESIETMDYNGVKFYRIDSPYEVKNYLLSQKEPQRVLEVKPALSGYDDSVYLVGNANKIIHYDMLTVLVESEFDEKHRNDFYKYQARLGFLEDASGLIFYIWVPKDYVGKHIDYNSGTLGWDEYYDAFVYKNLGYFATRYYYKEFRNNFTLIDIMGKSQYIRYIAPNDTADEINKRKECRQIIRQALTENKSLTEATVGDAVKDLIKTFGLLNDPMKSDASYILKSGRILDTKGPYKNHQHENIADYISKKYNIHDLDENNGSKLMTKKLNAIRLTPWLNAIYIPEQKITDAQKDVLRQFISKAKISRNKPLLVANMKGTEQTEFTDKSNVEEILEVIMMYYIDGKLESNDYILEYLTEDTRTQLVNNSRNKGEYRDTSRGKNRFERKKYSKVAQTTKSFNTINMNDFFKSDILEVEVPVNGETDNYMVTIKMEGVVKEIARNIKSNNNNLEFKTVIQSLTKIFNTTNIYVKCTCKDFLYNFAHWNIVKNVSTEDSAHDPGPGKGIRNPNDDKGRGCKHILLVLNNGDWLMKVASVIKNYIFYAEENMKLAFDKIIFPKLYGVDTEEAQTTGIIPEDIKLDSEKHIIEVINDWAKNRGKFKKGSNINPAYAKKASKNEDEKEK